MNIVRLILGALVVVVGGMVYLLVPPPYEADRAPQAVVLQWTRLYGQDTVQAALLTTARFLQEAEPQAWGERIQAALQDIGYQHLAELQEEGTLPPHLTVRTNRYLNNLIEQDHRRVKQRVRPMLGFKRLDYAAIPITGIELVHQIKKEQFDVSALCSSQARTAHVWEAGLGA